MKKRILQNRAVQEGIFFLLLGLWLLWYSLDAYGKSYIKDWAQSPSLFPLIIAVLLCVLALITLVRGWRESCARGEKGGGQGLQLLILLGMILAYYLALSVIELPYLAVTVFSLTMTLSTFEVATVVFLAVMMAYMGVRSKKTLVLVSVGATVFLSVMFRTLLHVLLP